MLPNPEVRVFVGEPDRRTQESTDHAVANPNTIINYPPSLPASQPDYHVRIRTYDTGPGIVDPLSYPVSTEAWEKILTTRVTRQQFMLLLGAVLFTSGLGWYVASEIKRNNRQRDAEWKKSSETDIELFADNKNHPHLQDLKAVEPVNIRQHPFANNPLAGPIIWELEPEITALDVIEVRGDNPDFPEKNGVWLYGKFQNQKREIVLGYAYKKYFFQPQPKP